MNREAIVKAASKMTSIHDFLVLLNKIKMDELGEKGHPFTMPQLNYFINPKRNRSHYKTFTIPKKSGGVRTISAPTKMLKSMQTYTNRILQAFYVAPECVTGFVPSRSVVDNAERHVGMLYVFNTDLKDFFPSIPQARVWGALKCQPFGFDEKVASAIAGLCCTEIHLGEEARYALPQGSPCSPILTNIVCHNLDWKLSGLARRFHLRYSRYADDITFSSNQNVYQEDGEFMTEFRRIVKEQNFTINDKKTRLQKRGERQEVTGLVVSDRVNVSREFVRDLDNLLFIWEKHGIDSAFAKFIAHYTPKLNLHEGNPDMSAVIQGKLMYLRMVKGEDNPAWMRLQKRFNRLIDRKKSTCGTDIVYLHHYCIEAFEKAIGATITFMEGNVLDPYFIVNGHKYPVTLSKYAATRLRHILESGDEDQLKKFKHKYQIAYCQYALPTEPIGNSVFDAPRWWMIFRGMRKKNPSTLENFNPVQLLDGSVPDNQSATEELDKAPLAGMTTDEVLDALVGSDFDLSILEEWEKTKRNN